MPVSPKIDSFSKQPIRAGQPLRTPQARILKALQPAYPNDPVSEWPLVTRTTMRTKCGMSPTNSMNRILHGVKDGKSKHLGLIEMGLVEAIKLDIDGVVEYNYRITQKGMECLSRQVAVEGNK